MSFSGLLFLDPGVGEDELVEERWPINGARVRPTAATKIKKRSNFRLFDSEAEVEELRSMFAAALRLQCDQIFRQKVAQCVAQINS